MWTSLWRDRYPYVTPLGKSALFVHTFPHEALDHDHAGDAGKEIEMANHKRKRVKSRRAGCLMCKPHKAQWAKDREHDQTMQERRARVSEREQRQGSSSDP